MMRQAQAYDNKRKNGFRRPWDGRVRKGIDRRSVEEHAEEAEGNVMEMKEMIALIARSLVDRPEEVEVRELVGEHTSVLELKVAKEDLGKVIGKQGRTATAMRTILNAASKKLRRTWLLEIVERPAGGGASPPFSRSDGSAQWKK